MKKQTNNTRNRPPFKPRNDRPRAARKCPDVARDAAAHLIWQVLDEGITLDEAMMELPQFADLDGRDRGFAAAIAKSTLRYNGYIEKLMAANLQKPLPDTANYVRALLKTGVAQYLAQIAPVHAIIDRAVELAKFDKKAFGMAGLINAVLRKIITQIPNEEFDISELLPNVWRTRLINTYGLEITKKIAQSLLKPAPIDLTIKPNLNPEEIDQVKQDFGNENAGKSIRIEYLPENFSQLASWSKGDVWIQDAAASLPAQILKPKPHEKILDMCAAPGGKTMQLAGNFAQVTAVDLSETRLKLVAQNMARTGLHAKLLAGDAKNFTGDNEWDAILLDAPCSATGTLRRNLETLWIKSPFDLPKLLEIQCELIRAAAKGLKAGGRLVYAVCSMEKEEGDLAITAALEAGLMIDKITNDEVFGIDEAIDENGCARLLPYMLEEKGGIDGFFIARFVKPE